MVVEYTIQGKGTQLHVMKRGMGKPVLMIHGACADGSFFDAAAEELSSLFTVVTYDRRGYGKSTLEKGADCSVSTQAEDAAVIINNLGEPVHIVAHSAGCSVAMELQRKHPEFVRRVVLDEPLFTDCVPFQCEYRTALEKIDRAIGLGNYSLALHLFLPILGNTDPHSRASQVSPDVFRHNCDHFIRNEYAVLAAYTPSYETFSGANAIVLCSELDHGEHYPACAAEIANRCKLALYHMPGTHNFPADLPQEFACFIAGALLL